MALYLQITKAGHLKPPNSDHSRSGKLITQMRFSNCQHGLRSSVAGVTYKAPFKRDLRSYNNTKQSEAEMPRMNSPHNNLRGMMCRLSIQASVVKMKTCCQTVNEIPQKPSWHLWHKTEAMLLKWSLLAKVTISKAELSVIRKVNLRCMLTFRFCASACCVFRYC